MERQRCSWRNRNYVGCFFVFVFMDFKNGKFNFICVGQERDDRRQSSLTIISIKSFFLCDGVVQKCQLLSGPCNKKKSFCKPAFSTVFFFYVKKGKKNSQLGILVHSEALQKVVPGSIVCVCMNVHFLFCFFICLYYTKEEEVAGRRDKQTISPACRHSWEMKTKWSYNVDLV